MTGEPRIGIDLGGTKIEGIVLRGPAYTDDILARRRIPTQADRGYEHILDAVLRLVGELAEECKVAPPYRLGVGMPGSVTRNGLVKNSNTVCLNGTRFRDELSKRLGQPVAFANDANCFALAEARMGAGRGGRLVFGVIMGTGVGGGIVVDGRIHEGPQSIAGEWGHAVVRPDSSRLCYCGKRGCVETYLSGTGIERHFAELSGERRRVPEIIALREAGDSNAEETIETWLDHYGRSLANVINTLDPDIVVLGGGVSQSHLLYDEGRRRVAQYVFSDELVTPIVRHALGDSAGVFGAALLT